MPCFFNLLGRALEAGAAPAGRSLFVGIDVGLYKKCVDYGGGTLVTGLPRVLVSDLN